MKSQRIVKEIVKTEKLPQGQTMVLPARKNKNGSVTSNVYTVKETTLEKRVKRSYNNTDGPTTKSYQTYSSNLKQGTNSGYNNQNKIPVSNKEQSKVTIVKTTRSTKNNITEGYKTRRYSKRELDKIVKIQNWWRRMLAILDGYKIRDSLFSHNQRDYVVKSQKIYTEKYVSNKNNQPMPQDISSPQSYTSINNINNMNQSSKSYTNINNVTTTIKRNLNTNIKASSSQNYIKTIDKRIVTQSSPRVVQSVSTSPSVKSKYIIETKKVEVFRKPKTYSEAKIVKESNVDTINTISNYDVKQLMRDIWSNETYCSTVESLCCLGDDGRSNISQNTVIFEEYEEEIRKLKNMLNKKDNELNNLVSNLKETRKELKEVNITKNMRTKTGYGNKYLDQDAHELQIISTKLGWNDLVIPSPINEIFIESIENKIPPRMQYIEGMQIMGNDKMRNKEIWSQKIRTEESIQESVSDGEAVLEIQEMNALSIISNKIKQKNICQHLQSLMILSKPNDDQNEEKIGIEVIPVEKEPLVFQKIEQINIRSKPKPRKPHNQIQELDGLEIINYKRAKVDLKRKVKPKFVTENIDKINLKSLIKKEEKKTPNMIQELDGIEILKTVKEQPIPQCVDELEIMREYDMLLVKPTWNSLQIQGSGLNLLALPRDMGLENQEVDEFEILGMDKPELYIQSLEKLSYHTKNNPQKIQVLIPLPSNSIDKLDNFKIKGIKTEPQVKIVEKIVEKKETKKIVPNKIIKSDKFQIKGKVQKNIKKISKLENFVIKGREKIDNKKISTLDELFIKGKEKVDRKKIVKNDKFQIKGKEKKIIRNKIQKVDKIKIEGLEEEKKEEKVPEENIQESVIDISIIRKQKKIVPNTIRKLERFRIKGAEKKKVEPNKIRKLDRFKINAVVKESNKINNIDRFRYSGKIKEDNKINNMERFRYSGKKKEKLRISNVDKIKINGLVKEKNKINKENKFVIRGIVKEVKKEVLKEVKKEEKKVEKPLKKKESNKISNVDKFRYSGDKKVIMPNKIKKVERFRIIGIPKVEKQEVEEKEELFPEYVESIVIKGIPQVKQKPKVVEKVVEKIVEKNIDWNKSIKPIKTTKLILKNAYNKVIPRQATHNIVEEEEEIETVEKIFKNWNNEIKPVKTTKLNIKGILYQPQIVEKVVEKIVVKEKEKEEFDIENFVINICDSGKKFRESLQIETAGFDLEGNKGMILKEGPAETIKINKEQILIPSKISQFNIISNQPEKVETVVKNWNDFIDVSHTTDVSIIQNIPKKEEVKKPEVELQTVKENKLFISGLTYDHIQQSYKRRRKDRTWNDLNAVKRQGSVSIVRRRKSSENLKEIEQIITTVNKDWNMFNEIENKDNINLLSKKKVITLAKQRTNSINLISNMEQPEQVVQVIDKRNWVNTLQAQRNAKFALYGKPKMKKYKLIVANGDKFFIQKESEDEIIYNDDYNTRNGKHKYEGENEGEKNREIIKEKEVIREKEIIPRLQREIRAQISRLKESESETSSSISEIDVLAGIKRTKTVGYAAASGEAEAALLKKYKKSGELNGYQTKRISGEVVFTAKNGLGVNLGGAQYLRQINGKKGYIKKIENISNSKISGIEISMNPKIKSEVYYQKMSGASGAIADGNYKFIGTSEILNDKGLAGSVSCKQMKIVTDNTKNLNPEDFGYNGQKQTYRKEVVITTKTESGSHTLNNLNGQSGSTKVIFNNRTIDSNQRDSQKSGNSGNSGISGNSRKSGKSGNSKKIKIKIKNIPNSGNSIRIKEMTAISGNNNDLDLDQPMNVGKVVFSGRANTESNQTSSNVMVQGPTQISRKEYEMRVQTNGNKNNEKVIKKVTEVKIKKSTKGKKVEPLRDDDIQNNF